MIRPDNNSELQNILDTLITNGKITTDDVQDVLLMNKESEISKVHSYKIWQGTGKDKRWFTRIPDEDCSEGRRKIAKATKAELINYLYEFYYRDKKSYKNSTLTDVYEEWISYKLATVNRTDTVYRIDKDYQKFYVDEPLSLTIMTTPLLKLTVADIKEWAYLLIKKHSLTKKAYYNASTIIRQIFDWLIEKEVIDKNPCKAVKITPSAFRKSTKKPADTQIFYSDEIEKIVSYCITKANESGDVAFLAIPLFVFTGLRLGECLALSFRDCDRNSHSIYVHQMLASIDERLPDGTWQKREYEIVDFLKGNGDPRTVIVSDQGFDIIDMIKAIHSKNKLITGLLFPNISENNVRFKLYRICNSLGINVRSPHKIRKTYVSTLLNNGIDADFVRTQVGHKDLQTTFNSYVYTTSRNDRQIEQLNDLLAVKTV